MMIGFGSTEVAARKQIIREVAESLIANGKTGIVPVRHKYKKINEEESGKPRGACMSRYSSFSGNVWEIFEGHMIAELSICHTSRGHAMSPDGWAAMFENVVIVVSKDHNDKWEWSGLAEVESGTPTKQHAKMVEREAGG